MTEKAKDRRPRGYKRPAPFALPGNRYPIGNVAHANFAITRLYMKTVTDEDRKKVIKAIKDRYPKNKALMARIEKLEKAKKKTRKKPAKKKPVKKAAKVAKKKKATKKKRTTKKKKTTKKGNRRKGQPKGARLAYDDLKKKKKKAKRKPKKETGLLGMLTSELHEF